MLVAAEGEAGRHHADDHRRRAAHLYGAPDNAGVTTEDAAPSCVGQHDDGRLPWFVLVRRERASEHRPNTENGEDIRAEPKPTQCDRIARPLIGQTGVADDANVRECGLVAPVIDVISRGELRSRRVLRNIVLVDGHEPLGMSEGEWPQQHTAYDGEDGAVRADA